MNKLFVLLAVIVGSLSIQAADYNYLTFETTDGAKVSVSVSSLTISLSGTTLTAGEQSFTLTNLSKMYFSASDETDASGIEQLSADNLDETAEIYDMQGRMVQKDQMHSGVYIIKSKRGTYKIVKK